MIALPDRQSISRQYPRKGNDPLRVAAYQAPLLLHGSMDALEFIRLQVRRFETERIRILRCRKRFWEVLRTTTVIPPGSQSPNTDALRNTLSPVQRHGQPALWDPVSLRMMVGFITRLRFFSEERSSAVIASYTRRFAGPFIRQVTKLVSSRLKR